MESFDLRLWPGLSATGLSTATPLIVDQICIDSRRIDSSHALFVALQGAQDGHNYVAHAAEMGCKFALVKKSWQAPTLPSSILLIRVEDPLKSFQNIAQAYRIHLNVPVIAIAGSNGKTMVKDLLQMMLERNYRIAASPESFNSQIGVPLSLLTIRRHHQFALIEVAFSKLGEMDLLAPLIGASSVLLTHNGAKHAASMGGLEAIAKEYLKLLRIPGKDGWIISPTSSLIDPEIPSFKAQCYSWSTASQSLPHAEFLPTQHGRKATFKVGYPDGSEFLGRVTSGFYYFLDLINMTTKAAWLMGISANDINAILEDYAPVAMRTEIWKSPSGATFINDTYCSDPQSIDVALKHFELVPSSSRKTFIFHGIKNPKKQETSHYKQIGRAFRQSSVDQLLLIGNEQYDSLVEEIKNYPLHQNTKRFDTLAEASDYLHPMLGHNDAVLIKGAVKQHQDVITEAFNDGLTNNQCIINLAAIKHNLTTIRKKLQPGTKLMVIIKALAYGTDDLRMAHFLSSQGVNILGLAHADEAVVLRRAGVKTEIFVINIGAYEAIKAVKWDLQVGVSEIGLIEALASEGERFGKKIKVHLHVNTGMSRLGCRLEDTLELAKRIVQSEFLELEGILTHFASADDPDEDCFTLQQANLFTEVIDDLSANGIVPKWKHAANSSGVLRFDFPQFNMARVGLAVYGLHASEASRKSLDLRLAFSLISRIVGINTCKKGETISYGRTYTVAKEKQLIAVLPIGYFDGLHRHYSGKGHVVIRGKQAPMVGRITMDYMMVDVTDIPHAAIGDPVLLFGEDEFGHCVLPEDFAFKIDSIPHEIITCLGPRIQRIFVYEEAHEKKNILGVYSGSLPKTA